MWLLKLKLDYFKEPIEVTARDVDFTNIPVVTISGIEMEHKSSLIIVPETEAYSEMSKFESIIVPYSNIMFAGKVKDDKNKPNLKVIINEN